MCSSDLADLAGQESPFDYHFKQISKDNLDILLRIIYESITQDDIGEVQPKLNPCINEEDDIDLLNIINKIMNNINNIEKSEVIPHTIISFSELHEKKIPKYPLEYKHIFEEATNQAYRIQLQKNLITLLEFFQTPEGLGDQADDFENMINKIKTFSNLKNLPLDVDELNNDIARLKIENHALLQLYKKQEPPGNNNGGDKIKASLDNNILKFFFPSFKINLIITEQGFLDFIKIAAKKINNLLNERLKGTSKYKNMNTLIFRNIKCEEEVEEKKIDIYNENPVTIEYFKNFISKL